MRTNFFIHWFFSFYYIFFRDRRSNVIDGSDIASTAFWKKENFLIIIRF